MASFFFLISYEFIVWVQHKKICLNIRDCLALLWFHRLYAFFYSLIQMIMLCAASIADENARFIKIMKDQKVAEMLN